MNGMTEKLIVSVLGTGIMGAAMARNLVAKGHDVRVWNRSPEKAAAWARRWRRHPPRRSGTPT